MNQISRSQDAVASARASANTGFRIPDENWCPISGPPVADLGVL